MLKVLRLSESDKLPERVTLHIPAELLLKAVDGGYNLTLVLPDARLVGMELTDAGAPEATPGFKARVAVKDIPALAGVSPGAPTRPLKHLSGAQRRVLTAATEHDVHLAIVDGAPDYYWYELPKRASETMYGPRVVVVEHRTVTTLLRHGLLRETYHGVEITIEGRRKLAEED